MMGLSFPSFPSLCGLLLFVFMLLKKRICSEAKKSSLGLPPGPWKLPLIGNMHQLLGSLPHHSLRDLAMKYGPLMHLRLGQVSTIVVSSPEVAREVLRTHGILFAGRPYILASRILAYEGTDIAFSPYGNYWRQLRKICTLELLSAKRVHSFRSIREEEVSNFIREISSSARAPFNFTEKIFSLIYGVTARLAFGKKSKDQEAFISFMKIALPYLGGLNIADMYPSTEFLHTVSGVKGELENAHQMSDMILGNIVNEHKERKTRKSRKTDEEVGEDLVDVLLKVQEHNDIEFSDNNIKAVLSDMFSAGGETSSTTVEWAMSELLKNPCVMKRAQDEVRQVFKGKGTADETGLHELKYLKSVIKETLRLHPAAPLLVPRECRERCEINGYEIPSKTRVLVNVWAIGRDPKYWTNAEKFEPERFLNCSIDYMGSDFVFIPFGAGRRICPGITFAMANIELLLAQLLYHFDWELPDGMKQEELDMTEKFGMTVKRKWDLHLIPIPYYPMPAE